MASKNKIKIKESKKGTFTKTAKQRNKSVQSFANQVLANKDKYSPAIVKKANFARNATKFKHKNGGIIKYPYGGSTPLSNEQMPLSTYQYRDQVQYQQPTVNYTNTGFNSYDPYGYTNMYNNPAYNNVNFEKGQAGQSLDQYYQAPKSNIGTQGSNSMYGFMDFGEQGNFGDTQYGNYNSSGTMAAAGVVGSVGSSLIDTYGKDENQQMYTDSGPSWSQQLVGSAGPWGAAISAVSQLGESALETGIDYNEYGVAENQSYNQFASSLETGLLDPAQNLNVVFSDDYSTEERIGSLLLPGAAGIFEADKEQEEAEKREKEARKAEALRKRQLREQNPQAVNANPTVTYPDGGLVGYDANGNPIYNQTDTIRTATYIPNELRPRTYQNTLNTAVNNYGITRDEFITSYKADPEGYTKSLANQYPNKYKAEKNSLGKWTLSEYIPNSNKKVKFPDGGMVEANAELETDEVFRTPDGSIEKVPEGTPSHANGGIKMSLPEGTEILGKMKGKYTNGKSYKEIGQELKKKYDKYTKASNDATTTIGKRTADLMLNKVQKEFDSLMAQQEIISKMPNKMTEWTSDEQGNPIAPTVDYEEPRYAKGGKIPKYEGGTGGTATFDSSYDDKYAWWNTLTPEEKTQFSNVYSYVLNNPDLDFDPGTNYLYAKDLGDAMDKRHDPTLLKKTDSAKYNQYVKNTQGGEKGLYNTPEVAYNLYHSNKYKDYVQSYKDFLSKQNLSQDQIEQAIPKVQEQPVVQESIPVGNTNSIQSTPVLDYSDLLPNYNTGPIQKEYVEPLSPSDRGVGWWDRNESKLNNIGTGLGTAAQLAPALYNMYMGIVPEIDELDYKDYRNPYRGRILRDLGDINYNIKPELEANELAYQTARRNMRQVAPGVGNLLSNYNALAGTRMRADAGAYARKQNMENQLRQQRAGLYGQLGAQESQMRYNVDLANQAAEAQKQKYLQTGLTQLGQSAYNWQVGRNQQANQDRMYRAIETGGMPNFQFMPDGSIVYNGQTYKIN